MAWRGSLGLIVLFSWAGMASGFDRVVLEIGEISVAGMKVNGATAVLDLTAAQPTLTVKAQQATIAQTRATFRNLGVACVEVVIKEPQFACRRAHIVATGGPTGKLSFQAAAGYDTEKGALSFEGSGLAMGGGQLRFAGELNPAGWAVTGRADALQLPQVRKLVAPWAVLPDSYAIDGRLDADAAISGLPGAMRVRFDARSSELNFTNEAGTIVAEKVDARVKLTARQTRNGFDLEAGFTSARGQALAGPVLLDFGVNPLQLDARGRLAGGIVELDAIALEQKNLLTAKANARVRLEGKPAVARARVELTSVEFPAAYISFLQIALAATDFGTLTAAGSARGAVEIADDRLTRLDVKIADLDLKDDQTQFMMADLRGDLHWMPAGDAPVESSYLAWSKTQAYGLSGGTARLDFRARGFGFELTREARVPIFDGAVVVHSLAARNLGGSQQAELDFDAHIEPISMPLISKAFGWPELSGQLAGRIPGLTYRNGLLALNGDLTANVFGGTITGSNFRLRDPLGPWPRLFADITARRLDLELVTSTFSIGSITGRLDADLKGLELFNWSPVAFDARLYSSPGSGYERLISQKAVTSISSIGGGAGGVTKALQSGVLRFFDEFRYDRIGINCRLRNEVCLMTGVEPHGAGYYIVKGRGIPRIDIIGNAGRVDWPQLVTQIVQGMRSENVIVR